MLEDCLVLEHKMQVIANEVLLFSQIFGGLPLKYVDDPRGERLITFSPMVCVWGWIVITLQTFLSQITLYVDYQGKLSGDPIRMTSKTAIFAVILDVMSLNIMALVVFSVSFRQYKKFIEMCHLLARVDLYFKQTSRNGDRIKIFLVVSYMTTLMVANVVQESFINAEGNNTFVYYIPVLSLYCIEAALFIQFTFVTENIAKRFRQINEAIKQAVISKSFGQLLTTNRFVKVDVIPDDKSCLIQLRDLNNLYWLLCDAVQHANAFYGNQLLAAVFSAFVHIIITLYYLFLHLGPGDVSYLIMQGLWVLTHIIHLVLLVWPSTALTDAANETAPMVSRLMNRDLNYDVKKQLRVFLLQLFHHDASLSARGFFQVHSHILSSIAGSVTTYLVILIQFQTTPSSGVVTHTTRLPYPTVHTK